MDDTHSTDSHTYDVLKVLQGQLIQISLQFNAKLSAKNHSYQSMPQEFHTPSQPELCSQQEKTLIDLMIKKSFVHDLLTTQLHGRCDQLMDNL